MSLQTQIGICVTVQAGKNENFVLSIETSMCRIQYFALIGATYIEIAIGSYDLK